MSRFDETPRADLGIAAAAGLLGRRVWRLRRGRAPGSDAGDGKRGADADGACGAVLRSRRGQCGRRMRQVVARRRARHAPRCRAVFRRHRAQGFEVGHLFPMAAPTGARSRYCRGYWYRSRRPSTGGEADYFSGCRLFLLGLALFLGRPLFPCSWPSSSLQLTMRVFGPRCNA